MITRIAPLTAAAVLALTTLAGCPQPPEPTVQDDSALQRFSSCAPMKDYLGDVMLETLLRYRYDYWMMPMAEDAANETSSTDGPTDYTDTNNQEAGVDELDIVKTDGQHLFVAQDTDLQIIDSWPVEEAELVATLPLEGWARGLFLDGDTVVVFEQIYNDGTDSDLDFLRNWTGTRAQVVDITNRSNPIVTRTIDIEGYLADARLIDGDVYLVMNHWMQLPQEAYDLIWGDLELPEPDYTLEGDALEASRTAARAEARAILEPLIDDIVADMSLDDVLPMWRDQDNLATFEAEPEAMLQCNDIYRPAATSQYNVLSIVNLDLRTGNLNATGVLSDGWTVYASEDNLYVAQTSWWSWWGWGAQDMTTQIHKFELGADDGQPRYAATGVVDGWLYDQFAMSEHDGVLRVATTDIDWWWGWWGQDDTEEGGNNIFVLSDDRSGSMDTIGELRGLAPGEQIYASRMMGDTGYIVTFRQIDPLFTLDLSDPTNPTVLGELKIPGYSAYLHPMGDDHLLAVGMAGDMDGNLTGLAVNVFDVSDLANPVLRAQHTIESDDWSWSEALWDHHAFTYHRGVLSIPAYTYDWDPATGDYDYFSGIISLEADSSGISEIGRVNYADLVADSECLYSRWYDYDAEVCSDWGWYASLRRTRYIEDNLFSISNYGVKVTDLNDPEVEKARVLFYPNP